MNRIVGLETEYGCLTNDFPGTPSAITRVRDWIFRDQRYGLIDVHQRDWVEPAGNGGFLFNGGRAYVDMGHLEYCTPECLSLIDLLRYDRAGDAILLQALKEMHLSEQVSFIRNNVDHYSGATFGCHENYLVRRSAPLTEGNVLALLSFLTLRLLFAGSGRVGPWLAPLADGRCANAVELLCQFFEAARSEFRGRATETDVVLRVWEEVLSAFATTRDILVGKVDWITKRWLFRQFMERENISWSDPWLKAQDLEFHHVDPARNLGFALARTPMAWDLPTAEMTDAMRSAPVNTRAQARSR